MTTKGENMMHTILFELTIVGGGLALLTLFGVIQW
jgi:hypothetical protein